MNFQKVLFLIILIGFYACDLKKNKDREIISPVKDSLVRTQVQSIDSQLTYSQFEKEILSYGLTDILMLDSTIKVNLKYASEDNFMSKNVYGDLTRAFLQPEAAEKLIIAQSLLKSKFPVYSLVIYDALRPLHIQQKMWDLTDLPISEKTKYLSNPKNGSVHNYGAAVDLSILDENGEELDMGTLFDFFGDLAQPAKEQYFLNEGKLSEKQVSNRKLLRDVMRKAGFSNLPTEWWHFNSCNRAEAKRQYKIIN